MKEQEENQLDQDNDEILYTYARDNERKVKFNYPHSSMQNILVASKLGPDENNFDISHSYFSSKSPLPSLSPSLSPAYIQHSSRTNENYSPIILSPPPPEIQTPSCVKKNTDDSPVILRMNVDLNSNCKPEPSTGPQQQILIVNSLQSLISLTERSVITFMNKKSILKILSRSHLPGQSFVSKTSRQTNGE